MRGFDCEFCKTRTQGHKRKETGADEVRLLGLDLHAETIAVAMAEPDNGEIRSLGMSRAGKNRCASWWKSCARQNNCRPVTKRGRRGMFCTAS